jgi:hypothetical protein
MQRRRRILRAAATSLFKNTLPQKVIRFDDATAKARRDKIKVDDVGPRWVCLNQSNLCDFTPF